MRVSGADWARLGEQADRVARFIGNRAYMRMRAGHCIALDEGRAPDGALEFRCSHYDRRPQICRDLGRGSPACEAELMTKRALAGSTTTKAC